MRRVLALLAATTLAAPRLTTAQPPQRDPQLVARRDSIERALEAVAVVDRKVMVPMRDGARMAADIYRPKTQAKAPVIFSRTPYNFNYWDVRNGTWRDMSTPLDAVRRGY